MRGIVFDGSLVKWWMAARMPYPADWPRYHAIGLERNGQLVAGVLYEGFGLADVNMHVVSDGPNWLTRNYLRVCFAYPFLQLGLRRVTGLIPSKNEKSLKFAQHLGFKVEGLARHALPDDDIVITGMIREECRFIRQAQK